VNAEPVGLAIIGSDLYWCNFLEGVGNSLAHAALQGNGSTIDLHFVDGACGNYVAANSASRPPAPPPPPPPAEPGPGSGPSSSSSSGPGTTPIAAPVHAAPKPLPSPKLKLNAKAGTAALTLSVPGPGVVVLSGPAIKGLRKIAKAAGPLALVVRPTAKTAKKLKRDGRVKVIARIAFTPTGGTPDAVNKTLTLKLRGPG
jgi:hypothetical protein